MSAPTRPLSPSEVEVTKEDINAALDVMTDAKNALIVAKIRADEATAKFDRLIERWQLQKQKLLYPQGFK